MNVNVSAVGEPSAHSRALARSFIERTIRRMQGQPDATPAALCTSPHKEAARASVDKFSNTFDAQLSADNASTRHLHSPTVDVKFDVRIASSNGFDTPFHNGEHSDSVSHYLQNKLEVDQGVGERYEAPTEITEMQRRIDLEQKRLDALRQTRKQVDERSSAAARESRQAARSFNHRHGLGLHQSAISREVTTRSGRSEALQETLERERMLLAKARDSAATSSLLASNYRSGTRHSQDGTMAMSNQAPLFDRDPRQSWKKSKASQSEIAKLLEEQRAMLAKEKATRQASSHDRQVAAADKERTATKAAVAAANERANGLSSKAWADRLAASHHL